MTINLTSKETELILCALEGLRDINVESKDFYINEEEFLNEINDLRNLYHKIVIL